MQTLATIAAITFVLSHILPVQSECPNGWEAYLNSDKCIKYFGDSKTYIDALKYCQQIGAGRDGSLVSIHNAFQNQQVAELVETAQPTCNGWIGLSDMDGSGTFVWTDGSLVDYQNWAAGLPAHDGESVLAYLSAPSKQKWKSSNNFLDKMCFVCQQLPQPCPDGWVYFSNACYQKYEVLNAENAEKHCEDEGAHLVSILSAEEQRFITDNVVESETTIYHIGLRRYGQYKEWYWLDGSPVVYTNWQTGEPSGDCDDNSHTCYVNANWGGPGKWDDVPLQSRVTVCKKKLGTVGKNPAQHKAPNVKAS